MLIGRVLRTLAVLDKERKMFQSSVFDYVNLLDKAADASWLRNEVIGNNISNATTPGYKRQDVAFESLLQEALHRSRYKTTDAKVSGLRFSRLTPRIYTDLENYSYRLDKNNVDPDTEPVFLAENQIKYQGLIDSINSEFENLQAVMK